MKVGGRLAIALGLVILACWPVLAGQMETVTTPMSVDYESLRLLLVDRAFPRSGQEAMILDEADGCRRIILRRPRLSAVDYEDSDRLRLWTDIDIHVGASILDNCLAPIDWQGVIELTVRPEFRGRDFQLHLTTIDSRLLDKNGQKPMLADFVYNLIKEHVHRFINQTAVDLGPPAEELKSVLPLMFVPEAARRLDQLLTTLRPGEVTVGPAGLRTALVMDVERPAEPAGAPAEPLSQAELDRFIGSWEAWDSFLVRLITSFIGPEAAKKNQEVIFETLIDSRYAFIRELTAPRPDVDLVRKQFTAAWTNLRPILRKRLEQREEGRPLGKLAFITAQDALAALDRIGPGLGLDISRYGLIRLARLLEDRPDLAVDYSYEVDEKLRVLLGFSPEMVTAPSAGTGRTSLSRLLGWGVTQAWAAADLKKWLVTQDNFEAYLPLVRETLTEAAAAAMDQGRVPEGWDDLFQVAIMPVAWQETCFRQFVLKNGSITFLRSYNNTSVGLMQINERVWRGIYDVMSLRWNIAYNTRAGCEILGRYIERAARSWTDPADRPALEVQAGAIYAMYNGGPRQFKKFLGRVKRGKLFLSDRLFAEKYGFVQAGAWDKVRICLFGG